jgi:hypothetical protein
MFAAQQLSKTKTSALFAIAQTKAFTLDLIKLDMPINTPTPELIRRGTS